MSLNLPILPPRLGDQRGLIPPSENQEYGEMCDRMVLKLLRAASIVIDRRRAQKPFVLEVTYVAAN